MYNKNWIQRGRRGLIHESCSIAHDDKMAQLLREQNVTDYPACLRSTRMCAHSACATLTMPPKMLVHIKHVNLRTRKSTARS